MFAIRFQLEDQKTDIFVNIKIPVYNSISHRNLLLIYLRPKFKDSKRKTPLTALYNCKFHCGDSVNWMFREREIGYRLT